MSLNDPLAKALNALHQAENAGKAEVQMRPTSKIILSVLALLKSEGYIAKYEHIDDGKGGVVIVTLNGTINKVGVVKPRFSVKAEDIEKYEKRYLPARNFGLLIVSTTTGLVNQHSAKQNKQGGTLIAYVY